MVRLRQKKVDAVVQDVPDIEPLGDDSGDLLVVGWGGTMGALRSATERARAQGKSVSHIQLRYINPFPANLGDLLVRFKKILVPELNLGQLATILRARYLVPTIGLNKVQGKPFTTSEVYRKIMEELED
jgi:2-oxoglutarate ferredoxin oxidoreductase subunit alpha